MISYLTDLQEAIKSTNFAQLDGLLATIQKRRIEGHRVFVAGNGGSYSVAQHWGVDLGKAANVDIYPLGANPALLTAFANDLDYEVGLSTELVLRAASGDILICLSCSGRSRNIVACLGEAKKLRMPAYLITGFKAPEIAGVHTIRIGTGDYGVLEDVFSAIGHWLTRELS